MAVRVVPTLAVMAEVYRLPADGGPDSPRFRAYVELGRSTEAIEALRRASDLAGATYNPLRPALAAAGQTVTA